MVEDEKNNNKIKVENKKFQNFLIEVKMKSLSSCLLDFKEDGLHIEAMSADNINFVKGFYKKEGFLEYIAIGNVGIDGVEDFVKVLKRFGKEITLEVNGNQCSISDNRKRVEIPLVEEKYIDKPTSAPENLTFDVKKEIEIKEIKDSIDDISINNDFALGFKLLNNKLYLYNTGKYKFNKPFDVELEDSTLNLNVKFGEPLIRVLSSFIVEGVITLSLKTDYPIKIERKTDNYEIMIYVAPRVDND